MGSLVFFQDYGNVTHQIRLSFFDLDRWSFQAGNGNRFTPHCPFPQFAILYFNGTYFIIIPFCRIDFFVHITGLHAGKHLNQAIFSFLFCPVDPVKFGIPAAVPGNAYTFFIITEAQTGYG